MSTSFLRVPPRIQTWQEGHRRNARLGNGLADVVDILFATRIEQAGFYGNTGTYLNGATIAGWNFAIPINERAKIDAEASTGIITIGADGWYTVSVFVTGSGSNNQAYYGIYINTTNLGQILVNSSQWDNNNPGQSHNGSIRLPLSAGEQVWLTVVASAGSFTCAQAAFGVEAEALT